MHLPWRTEGLHTDPTIRNTPFFTSTPCKGQRCVAARFSKLCGVGRKECCTSCVLRAETRAGPGGPWVAEFKTLPSVEWFCAPGASCLAWYQPCPLERRLRGVWCLFCCTRAPWSLEAEWGQIEKELVTRRPAGSAWGAGC